MKTPEEYYYTYYSYEEWGRGYFGSRGCKCLPEEDVRYFGSFKDKSFKPTQKIILKDDYATREEAYDDEIILQEYYKVVENPHFANRAYQTSTKFCLSKEERIKIGKKAKELGLGFHSLNRQQKSAAGKKGGEKSKELGLGICGLTTEQRIENGKKSGKKAGEKGGKRTKELKCGIFALSSQQIKQNASKGGKNTSSQKWMCLETGFITNAGTLSTYQKARGIDTTKRVRLE